MATTKRVHTKRTAPGPDDSLSVAEFCAAERFSAPKYYELKRKGLGPVEYRDGKLIRITAQSRRDWQAMMHRVSQPGNVADYRDQAAKAAKASVASPNHVAKRRVAARRGR